MKNLNWVEIGHKGPDVLLKTELTQQDYWESPSLLKNIENFSKGKKCRVILAWYPLWGW